MWDEYVANRCRDAVPMYVPFSVTIRDNERATWLQDAMYLREDDFNVFPEIKGMDTENVIHTRVLNR